MEEMESNNNDLSVDQNQTSINSVEAQQPVQSAENNQTTQQGMTPEQNQPILENKSPQEQPNSPKNGNSGASSIIAILLLLFLFPIGLIYMWIAAPWSKGFKWALTFIFVILPIGLLLTIMSLSSKGSNKTSSASISSQTVQEFSDYQATSININFSYPKGWVVQDQSGVISIVSAETQNANGKSLENPIFIQKSGTKSQDTTLLKYLIGQNQQQSNSAVHDSDFKDLGKTTNGYELVNLINTDYISNGQNVLTIAYPIIGVDSIVINKIIDSLKFR